VDAKRSPQRGYGPVPPHQPPANPVKRPGAVPAPAPARRGPGLQEALDQLGRDIRQMQIDFERFFNGGLPVPPEEIRGRVQAQLKSLRNQTLNTAVDSFRLGDFEARFNSYNELFNRRLRDREEGRQPTRALPVERPRYDPLRGIVVGERIDPEAAAALYQGLAAGPGEAPRFDLDSFQSYLMRQAAAIRAKTGCAEVQFRLADEDGKLKLKARPITASDGR
jgi:hypothetical protein